MQRFLNTLLRNFRSNNTTRRTTRRTTLQLEGLENRTVLSSVLQPSGTSTLIVNVDPGFFSIGPGLGFFKHIQHLTFQSDPQDAGKLDVIYNGAPLSQPFAKASINNVIVNVAGLDAVNVDDSNGLPFADRTTVSLIGSGSFNSLNLTGSRTISGGETYAAGNGAQAGSLTLGGSTYQFSSTIGSVTDSVKTTGSLVVKAFGQNVSLNGQNGVTQTLSGLSNGGAGDTLTYSNKDLVNLEMLSANASANLNATAAAAGEQFFVIDLFGSNQGVTINATPNTVATSVVAAGLGDAVFVQANSGRVFINGTTSTLAVLGTGFGQRGVTSGIKQDVFVEGVGRLALTDPGNNTTSEHVVVTESTISGTGLFGNDAAVVHYSDTSLLQIVTGELADTYTIVGSKPDARFGSEIEIDNNSTVGLSVVVILDAGSGLNLGLNNAASPNTGPASLFISALNGTFSHPTPTPSTGSEVVTFAGGLTSDVVYQGFTSVTHS
jgi:hypothetical protein